MSSFTGCAHELRLYLPVLCDSIPHPDLPCVAGGHQLVPDEEEIVHRDPETEDTWVGGGREEEDKGEGDGWRNSKCNLGI